MAQRQYSINLKEEDFPLLSIDKGRTVMGATSEEIYTAGNKPGILYCHNVLPNKHGMSSVGYNTEIAAYTTTNIFIDIRTIYGTAKTRLYLLFDVYGNAYILVPGSGVLQRLPTKITSSGTYDSNKLTVGTPKGSSYLYYSQEGCFKYDEVAKDLVPVILLGVTASAILGIADAYGYLLVYSTSDVLWSSTVNPVDFVPSEITGAGGGSIAGIKGKIVFVLSNSLGFLIYSVTNAVAATYTGNSQYPFKFRGIDQSKGGINIDLTAYESEAGQQFAYTKAGLQVVDVQKATTFLPEVSDFLESNRFEDYNEATGTLSTTLVDYISRKLKFVASRYLIISYGIGSYTHMLVYDIVLERLGKLKVDHVDVFEYATASGEVGRESIGILQPTGAILTVSLTHPSPTSGILILGKLQYTRSRLITLLETELENVYSATVSDMYSLDGRNTATVEGNLLYSATGIVKHGFRKTAINHSILIEGKFTLSTAIITYTLSGSR